MLGRLVLHPNLAILSEKAQNIYMIVRVCGVERNYSGPIEFQQDHTIDNASLPTELLPAKTDLTNFKVYLHRFSGSSIYVADLNLHVKERILLFTGNPPNSSQTQEIPIENLIKRPIPAILRWNGSAHNAFLKFDLSDLETENKDSGDLEFVKRFKWPIK